jgi:hypothetical protein
MRERMLAAQRTLRVERAKKTSSLSSPLTSWPMTWRVLPLLCAKLPTAHSEQTKDLTSAQTPSDLELSSQRTTSKPQVKTWVSI